MSETKFVSEEDFEKVYLPMTSEKTDSLMWEHKDTFAYPFRQVWSILESFDSDTDKLYAIPGYHIVNVIGYAVTEKEWETDDIEAIYYDYDANGHEGVRKD